MNTIQSRRAAHAFPLFLFFICAAGLLPAQIHLPGFNAALVHPDLQENRWPARWIDVPGEPPAAYGVYHFRKTFSLNQAPETFIVHVSADNRYKLYVNGRLASLGPARCDVYNWSFETLDIAPLLAAGKNTLAAVVWNYADKKPAAQMSLGQTGFIMQGNTAAEHAVNTGASWRCLKNTACSPWTEWKVLGYWAAGPGECVNAAAWPWGWERTDFDDSRWPAARAGQQGAMKGARDYPGRQLTPSPIPQMERREERFARVAEASGVAVPEGFPARTAASIIPANTTARLLLDNGALTTGYLNLHLDGGAGAEIIIGYAEALHENNLKATTKSYKLYPKQHRDETRGKIFIGCEDKYIADGGAGRVFTPLWWRTWRYVELRVRTAAEPLVLKDITGTFAAYPFRAAYTFSAPERPELNTMLDIGWRTARLCANESYMDCPYYEQLQYFGDTRIQAMITMYNTRDARMVKTAIEQGRRSIAPDGLTMSRYPSSIHQFIPPFSLFWICMGHDYWMYRGDEEYLKTLLPAWRGVLSFFEHYMKPDRSLARVPYWFFADWAAGFKNGGEPPREKDGGSAFQDLLFIMALDDAAEMERAFGAAAIARHYQDMSGAMRKTIRAKYWDAERKMFADTRAQNSWSQHVNTLAVLAEIVTGGEAAGLMDRVLENKTVTQATIYFRYYLHQAMHKAGLGDRLLDNLQIWRDQMALGLTTWAEMPEPARSDCHAWGASPNIELFRILLGIDSAAPGFKKIRVAPALCGLKNVSGAMPHPDGDISASYREDHAGALEATLALPPGTDGVLVWKNREYPLKAGRQTIKIPPTQ
ncbi:MAG: family 78 glycoside hydrolase catalytic domain [Opitutaceae bacterium]|jgi:hypothetical protein|nr:family 78 glycoside hydrolase catalytic domain [Opitutaceae bacterium]